MVSLLQRLSAGIAGVTSMSSARQALNHSAVDQHPQIGASLRKPARRRRVRVALALAALLCSAQVFAAVDLVVNNSDTGFDPMPAGGTV